MGGILDNLYNSIAYNVRTTFWGYSDAEKEAIRAQGEAATATKKQYFATYPGASYLDYYKHLASRTTTGILDQTGVPVTRMTEVATAAIQADKQIKQQISAAASTQGMNWKTIGIVAAVMFLVLKIIRR